MRILRGIAGALVWVLAVVLGLVAVVLCITVILLPAGLPLLGVSRGYKREMRSRKGERWSSAHAACRRNESSRLSGLAQPWVCTTCGG
jgi:hypothetical protein